MEQEPAVFTLFWDSLTEAGALDKELVASLKGTWSEGSWKPLGEILIRSKLLSVSQVAGLIGIQADEPHMRIGDLAIREGLCTPDVIEEALERQREACPGPIEIMKRDGDVDGDELLNALLIYVRFLEGKVLGLAERLSSKSDGVRTAERSEQTAS